MSDFRGTGIRYPLLPDDAGVLHWIDSDDNILQSVRLLLSTVVTERVMRPEFGTSAAHFLFEGDSDQNIRQLEAAIRDAIVTFEPRVTVDGSTATLIPGRDGAVQINVALRILRTNTQRNLVFPFYVGSETGQ